MSLPKQIESANREISTMEGCIEYTYIEGDVEITEFTKYGIIVAKRKTQRRGKIVDRWYSGGKKHRDEGPAETLYYSNGNKKAEYWYRNGEQHREDGPAWIWYYENGNKQFERWFRHDRHHRVGRPAMIEYYANGNIKEEDWCRDDK